MVVTHMLNNCEWCGCPMGTKFKIPPVTFAGGTWIKSVSVCRNCYATWRGWCYNDKWKQ